MPDAILSMARGITLLQPPRLEIGAGAARKLGEWAASYRRVFVVAMEPTVGFVDRLGLRGEIETFVDIPPEPDLPAVNAVLEAARRFRPDLVVGLGGGSVMDVAKLVAVLWDSQQTILDIVGVGKVSGRRTALAQVPTTSGTGSEAGIRSLVTNPETLAKLAVESANMLADIAILDPELTYSVPAPVTAATGIDALAHCVEAFTNIKAHPLIDGYARLGIDLVGRYLQRAVADGTDTEARAGMMLASYYGGICLGPVNTAGGHALAYPLGTRLKLPHGLANAIIFPHVLAFNAPVRAEKTSIVAQALGLGEETDQQKVQDGAWNWCRSLGVEMSLASHGAKADDLSLWAEEAFAIKRLIDNNPRPLGLAEIEAIYAKALYPRTGTSMTHPLADLLLAHRQNGTLIASFPDDVVPRDAAEAYRVQTETVTALGPVGAWKVQPIPDAGEPFTAPILASTVFQDGVALKAADFNGLAIEVEVAVTINHDLPTRDGGYTASEMRGAIGSFHVALEILASRFPDRTKIPSLVAIADLQNSGGVVLGPAVTVTELPEFSGQQMSLQFDGTEVQSTATGASTGNMLQALAWLANHAAARGLPLKQGDVVITGSRLGPTAFSGTKVLATAEGLGSVSCTF